MAATEDAASKSCGAFRWIGQAFTSCDRCGRPAWKHPGIELFTRAADDPFGGQVEVRLWKPGEAERIRQRWEAG